ncbi:MAG: CPBP family intramembrane glutamic endopeptidase [Hyphomicrobiaceae bacterium]|nr:CPBP family intramembrane glutamic endopeptidase [Hyphomicrobiaceae bacterium]
MPPRTFHSFLTQPVPHREPSRWHPALAALAAFVVVVLGQLAPVLAISMMTAADRSGGGAPDADTVSRIFQEKSGALLVLTQAVMAGLTLVAASRYEARATTTLALEPPDGGPRLYGYALLVMVPVLAVINALSYGLSPESFAADFKVFEELVRGPEPLLIFVAIVLGAPLWEELLFRGFLLPPLATALGFWPAAAVSSAAWAALHIGYSVTGLVEVFLIGLFFSWLLRQSGSLLVPMACHALYNAVLFGLLRYLT